MDAPARFPSKSTAINGAGARAVAVAGAAPTHPGRCAEHRRAAVNTFTRCHGVTLAAMTGGTADSAGCSLTAGFGAGLTEQAVFERRRHAPAGAPSTGELS